MIRLLEKIGKWSFIFMVCCGVISLLGSLFLWVRDVDKYTHSVKIMIPIEQQNKIKADVLEVKISQLPSVNNEEPHLMQIKLEDGTPCVIIFKYTEPVSVTCGWDRRKE